MSVIAEARQLVFRVLMVALSAASVAAPSTALAQAATRPSAPAAAHDDARRFVERFLQTFHGQFAQDQDRPDDWNPMRAVEPFFTPQLARALAEDRAAAEANTEEIVGLDFDPFSNSQDPCETYRTGRTAQRADTVLVEILGDCHGQIPLIPDAVYLLVRSGSTFAIADIAYPQGGNLLRILQYLAEQRKNPPPFKD